jgi:hypothetical protein
MKDLGFIEENTKSLSISLYLSIIEMHFMQQTCPNQNEQNRN